MKLPCLTFIIAITVSPALAQNPFDIDASTDQWASQQEVFVTNSARATLAQLIAGQLTAAAPTVGLSPEGASAVSQEIQITHSLQFAQQQGDSAAHDSIE